MTKKINIPRYRSTHNYQRLPTDYEKVSGKSETIPGEARTIRQLLEDFTTGIPLPLNAEEFYNKNADFETDVTHRNPDFDLTDVENIAEKYANQDQENLEKRTLTRKAENPLSKENDDQSEEASTDQGRSAADEPEKEKPKSK